jgi:hypothetical protein
MLGEWLLPYSEKSCETYDVTSIEGEENGPVVVSPALDDVPVGVRLEFGWVAEGAVIDESELDNVMVDV